MQKIARCCVKKIIAESLENKTLAERVFVVEESDDESQSTDGPVVTHTLVDLYIAQGHMDKAIEFLEKILELNPNDQRSLAKLNEVKSFYASEENDEIEIPQIEKNITLEETEDLPEADGRDLLMSEIDKRLQEKAEDSSELDEITHLANTFLNKLKTRSEKTC